MKAWLSDTQLAAPGRADYHVLEFLVRRKTKQPGAHTGYGGALAPLDCWIVWRDVRDDEGL